MFMRIYHKTLGGHVHMRVFVGENRNTTLGKAGDLCMRADEFNWWRALIERHNSVEFFCETPKAKGGA